MSRHTTIAAIIVGISFATQALAEVLVNDGDSWVRESAPATAYGGDLVTVWNSNGGDRRYGVISFDLTTLTEPVSAISLSLWSAVFGFSDDAVPLKQSAIAIDPAGIDPDSATWDQVATASELYTFESLGTVDMGAPSSDPDLDGVFIASDGSAADAAFVESVRSGAGTLLIVMIAEEGDTSYRGSWGDGEFNGEDAFLSTNSDVEVSDDPNLRVDPAFDFGQVTQGQGPFGQSLTIRNTGAVEVLTISGATVTGANAARFSVTSGTFPLAINPGESAEIEITFDPGGDLGLFEATLELASDDSSDAVVAVGLSGTSEAPSTAQTLANNGDSWVRESAPSNSYPGDLMSVWNSTGGDRRYGVISFDLSSLTDPIGGVALSLWSAAFGFSDDAVPLKQAAVAIDPSGIDPDAATWDAVASADILHTFESLGTVEIGAPSSDPEIDGVYIESMGSPADAAFVESVRSGSGTLMIVMIADEDATSYRASWGDGELGGEESFLTFEPAAARPQLQIDFNESTGELAVSWESKAGLLYNLRSETDLSIEPATWPIFAALENLPADPSGTNTETFSLPDDPERFFVVEQFPAPPVAVFEENFDGVAAPSLPTGWTTGADPLADTGTTAWELGSPSNLGPAAAKSAPSCVGTNLAADYGFDTDIWLRTPPIDLTAAAGATLAFQEFRDIEAGFDFGRLSVLDAADDSELAVIEEGLDGVTADWEKITNSLPAAALGRTIKIEFRFQADDVGNFPGWYIDDVVVTVP